MASHQQYPPEVKNSTPQIPPTTSWKDHPVAVAGASFAATLALCIIIMNQVILPTQTASLNNQLAELPKLKDDKEKLKASLAKAEKKLDEKQHLITLLQNKDLFVVGSPYPIGLSRIRLGDSITEIDKFFPSASIDTSNEGFIFVKLKDNAIDLVTYYFDYKSTKKLITHISFRLSVDKNFSNSFLQDKLINTLGKPADSPRKNFYSWKAKLGENIYKSHSRSFLVMRDNYFPGYWPAE